MFDVNYPPFHIYNLTQRYLTHTQIVGVLPTTDLSWGGRLETGAGPPATALTQGRPAARLTRRQFLFNTTETNLRRPFRISNTGFRLCSVPSEGSRTASVRRNVDERIGVNSFPVNFNLEDADLARYRRWVLLGLW